MSCCRVHVQQMLEAYTRFEADCRVVGVVQAANTRTDIHAL